MTLSIKFLLCVFALFALTANVSAIKIRKAKRVCRPMKMDKMKYCKGIRKYKVTFRMMWTRERFPVKYPDNAHMSPLTATSHKRRFSPFTTYGYADKNVETLAESGNNKPLIAALRANKMMVKDAVGLMKPSKPNEPVSIELYVDGPKMMTQVSAASMLAPTPDYFTGFNNKELCYEGRWRQKVSGSLFAYDAGTEKVIGTDQMPRQNIVRIIGKPFCGIYVGRYSIELM